MCCESKYLHVLPFHHRLRGLPRPNDQKSWSYLPIFTFSPYGGYAEKGAKTNLTTFLVKVEMKNPPVACVNRGGGMTWHGTLSNSVVIRQAGLKALLTNDHGATLDGANQSAKIF